MGNSQNPKRHTRTWVFVTLIIGCLCFLLFMFGVLIFITPLSPSLIKSTSTPAYIVTGTLPDFPWPPPKPSAFTDSNLGSIGDQAGVGSTLGDVDIRITDALTNGGYDEKSYFGAPNGFVIVTRLEQINSDGSPEYSNRWVSELSPISITDFSLNKYLDALFRVPKGRYRVFVFIVTSDLVIQSGTPVSQGAAQNWVIEGANKLPSWMKTMPYTKDHTCTVYVYEFIQSGVGTKANQNIPSEITGRQHLENAGLWETLEK